MTVDELRRELNDLSEEGFGSLNVVVTADGSEVLWQLEGEAGVDLTDPDEPNKLLRTDEVDSDDPNAVAVLI